MREETVRVITAGNAVLQKSHVYEVLVDLQQSAAAWSETQQVPALIHTTRLCTFSALSSFVVIVEGYIFQEDMEDAECPMEEETPLGSSPVSEAELDRIAGVLEELHHLLESASHSMVQPPGKAFPTSARITGPPERDNPYPTLYRYKADHKICTATLLTLV